jgi:hypothetical protein
MSMMFKMLSTVPLNVLLAFHDVDKTGELAAKIPELMTPESLAEAVNAVLSSDWSTNALGRRVFLWRPSIVVCYDLGIFAAVYNLLLNAQLIVSDERRRAALLRALTGNDGKLVFAAGLHMQRFSWPAAMDAELLNALVCVALPRTLVAVFWSDAVSLWWAAVGNRSMAWTPRTALFRSSVATSGTSYPHASCVLACQ